MSLICSCCKILTSFLYGPECEKCCYNNQPIDRVVRCHICRIDLGYYREFDFGQEPNHIDKVFCGECKGKQ